MDPKKRTQSITAPPAEKTRLGKAGAGIIFPTLLAVALFVLSIFAVIIPAFRTNIMDRKREMIRELTNSAWSVLAEYAEKEKQGTLSRAEAQARAVSDIRYLRYGDERKDYFWITDMRPYMVMHPYRPQLDGKDLSGKLGEDPTGKKLFVEMVEVCKKQGKGYVEYMWQWKDDPTRIVPKLSYVMGFEPWDWIIGTGIYIEDVKEEIAGMTGRLIKISTAIIILIALLLLYITQKSLKIEKKRRQAETGLRESENKYRALVEAATEGTMMVLEGRFIYSNRPILDMLGYTAQEFTRLHLFDILADSDKDTEPEGAGTFKSVLSGGGDSLPLQFEVRLKKKNGEPLDASLRISSISLAGKKGYIIIAADIGRHKKIAEELDRSKEKYKVLSDNLDIGVFRTTFGRKGRFIEANPAALKILGFSSKEALLKTTIFDLFHDRAERIDITRELLRKGFVKNRLLELNKKDGSPSILSVSCALVKDDINGSRYCDGIVEDITEQKRVEESRENLIVELQTAQLFLNRPIKHFIDDVSHCSMNDSIRKAADIMSKNNYSAILVSSENEADPRKYLGIVTDRDLRKRAVAEGLDLDGPVFEIMSSPLISIPDNALIFEAMLAMQEEGVRHLAVKDHAGNIVSLISDQQLIQVQRNSSAYLIKEIHEAALLEDIMTARNRLPRLVKSLVDSGANSKNICRVLTAVSDAVVERLIAFALEEMGPPPVKFAFMALGSEGREEQTLKTDQDNAIIYEDSPDPHVQKTAVEYFLKLGEKINLELDRCGYKLCKGDIMAQNPRWCRPLSGWQEHFSGWINAASPQDLLEVNIFFDFRCIYGQKELGSRLRTFIDGLLAQTPAFFQFMARNALLYKPPIGFFGNIVVESSGENPSTFDIKEAMKPIVNFARLYALKHNIEETNTQERLSHLFRENILTRSSYEEVVKVYDYLMQMRLKHQALALEKHREPDNFINPRQLTEIEHTLLKNTFSQINTFQKRLSYDFTGTA